jgi:predicted Rossmann fold flavoprotein
MTSTSAIDTHAPRPVVIIGAGASGLMAAVWAAGTGTPVVVLDGTDDGGRKLLITGGGRCNILPVEPAPERFVTDSSPHSLRNILRSWPLAEQRAFFEEGLALPLAPEPGTGKLFPECASARRVRDGLVEEARRRGAAFRFGVRAVEVAPLDAWWLVTLADGTVLTAEAVVLATGGCSVPATGSDGWGFEAASRLGHAVHPPYPALTPLTAEPAVHGHLAGITLDVVLTTVVDRKRTVAAGAFLFTHRGYSGPAVLDIAHVAVRGLMDGGARRDILVQWAPLDAAAWERLLMGHKGLVESLLAQHLPSRLARALCHEAQVRVGLKASQLPRERRLALLGLLTRYPLPWTGHEGYATAEITGGGVDLGEVDPRTLESRRHRGLHFCGEVLDAFGPIGGHNLQWAWATGRAAGIGAARGRE